MSDETRDIDHLLLEERRFPPPPEFAAQANAKPGIYDEAFEAFWEREGRGRVSWYEPFTTVLEWKRPFAKWFSAASSTSPTTASTATSRTGSASKVAFHWEGRARATAGRSPTPTCCARS